MHIKMIYMCVHEDTLVMYDSLWPLCTIAHQAPLSLGFSRQEHQSGLPYPATVDLPDPGIKPTSLKSPALADGFCITSATWEAKWCKT